MRQNICMRAISLVFSLLCVFTLSVLITTGHVFAQSARTQPEDFETTRGLALGTGLRASAIGTSAVLYNAAGIPSAKVYHLEGFGSYNSHLDQYSYGGTVVDSITNALGAGLALRGISSGNDQGRSGIDGKLALGFPLSSALSLGVAGRYMVLNPKTDIAGVDHLAKGFTVDAALRFTPFESLQIAALGYNLVDKHSAYVPRMLGGSAVFQVSSINIGGDMLFDTTTYDKAKMLLGGGLEFFGSAKFPLRFGYRYDQAWSIHDLTGGVGYVDTKFGFDVSVRQQISGGSATMMMAALKYFVQ